MRKITSRIFIVLGVTLLVVSTYRPFMAYLLGKRGNWSGWAGTHKPEGVGDLVSMGYLDNEKKFYSEKDYRFSKPADTGRKNINLYVFGDSYLWEVPDSAFAHVSHYQFGRRDYAGLNYTLDPHKKNILVIEDAERFVRIYFKYFPILEQLKKAAPALSISGGAGAGGICDVPHYAFLGVNMDLFFNPGINRNLEFNLFGYQFLDKIKSLKASATYQLFGRATGDVVVSEDGQYLFLRQTVASHDLLSSYEPFSKEEFAHLIVNLNAVYWYYKKEGFDEVYLSIIPNPASILQPNYYNGLIPALQTAPSLKMPTIDIYNTFKANPDPGSLYRLGDTHWNNKGLQLWLRQVNELLSKQADAGR